MKNTILPFLLCICCLYSSSIFSQKEIFKKGYIVLANGDTIAGEIKELSLMAHAEYVTFKKEQAERPTKYYPNQLSKYYFEDLNYYESNDVPFKNSSGKFSKKLFLKKLVDGEVELFRLDYKLSESSTPLFDYQSKYYFVRKKNSEVLIDLHEENYRSKLKELFQTQDCSSSKKNRKFDDEGLISLILEYSTCLGGKGEVVHAKKRKKKISWGLSAGLTSPNIQLADERFRDFIIEDQSGYDFHLFLLPRITNWLTCRIGINYQQRNQNGALDYTVPEFYDNKGEIFNLKSNAALTNLAIPLDLIFSKRINNLRLYGLTGIRVGTMVQSTFHYERANFEFIDNQSIQFEERISVDPTSSELGWSIGGGGAFHLKNNTSIFLEVQYSTGKNSFNLNSPFPISHQSITFLIGYNFNQPYQVN